MYNENLNYYNIWWLNVPKDGNHAVQKQCKRLLVHGNGFFLYIYMGFNDIKASITAL